MNIPGGDVKEGVEVCSYLPPAPHHGTGAHRSVIVPAYEKCTKFYKALSFLQYADLCSFFATKKSICCVLSRRECSSTIDVHCEVLLLSQRLRYLRHLLAALNMLKLMDFSATHLQ